MSASDLILAANSNSSDKLYVDDVFSAYTYIGNGSTQTINNGIDLAGKGGMVWVKNMTQAVNNVLVDTTRGVTNYLSSNTANMNIATQGEFTNFNANGFSLNSTVSSLFNANVQKYSSWTFRKAPKFFDIVTYVGDGINNRVIPHSLNCEAGMVIVKRLDNTGHWAVWHRSVSTNGAGNLFLNLSNSLSSTKIVNVDSTSFIVSNDDTVNINGASYVAYIYAHDASADGIIQCGSFTTDGSGSIPLQNLGWEAQYVLLKHADAPNGNWYVFDTARGFSLEGYDYLSPNLVAASSFYGFAIIAPNANGFNTATPTGGGFGSNLRMCYMAIRMSNRPPTSAAQVYNAIAYAGDTTTPTAKKDIVNIGFAPDLAMLRERQDVYNPCVFDKIRGANKILSTTNTNAGTQTTTGSYNFLQNGITLGDYNLHYSGRTYISHFFKRAKGFFDIVAYAGTDTPRTVKHNLGVKPELMIFKSTSSFDWIVYASFLGATQHMKLHQDVASIGSASAPFNSTEPTSTMFTVGSSGHTNSSVCTIVAYLFATLAGISKVGSYTGNGTTQNIECGFSAGARFVLIKRTDSAGDWYVWDTARGITADNDPHISLNTAVVEITTDDSIDPYANGFAVNQNTATNINVSGGTYIFLAIA